MGVCLCVCPIFVCDLKRGHLKMRDQTTETTNGSTLLWCRNEERGLNIVVSSDVLCVSFPFIKLNCSLENAYIV